MNPENALQNEAKALKFFEKAADQHNSIVALSELGNYYFRLSEEASGEEKSKNAKKSIQYFERASKLGDNQATYWLGKLNLKTITQQIDPLTLELGYVYHQGVGVTGNIEKSLTYLEEGTSFIQIGSTGSNGTSFSCEPRKSRCAILSRANVQKW